MQLNCKSNLMKKWFNYLEDKNIQDTKQKHNQDFILNKHLKENSAIKNIFL